MSKRLIAALLGAGALAVTTLTAGIQGADAASPRLTHISGLHAQRVCAAATAGHATCLSKVMVNKKGAIPMATAPLSTALSPTQLRSAYNLTGTSGAGRTVAIVDAYGYPNLERDLTIYRNFYGMPACTTANGCLRIIDQNGGTSLPRACSECLWCIRITDSVEGRIGRARSGASPTTTLAWVGPPRISPPYSAASMAYEPLRVAARARALQIS